MEKQNFENLNAWKKAKELCLLCYKVARKFPAEEKYALTDQVRRAAVSIPSNIAEGYSRKSVKDLSHFFNMAIGSIYEIMTQIDISLDLKYIESKDKENIFSLSNETLKLINGFLSYKRKD